MDEGKTPGGWSTVVAAITSGIARTDIVDHILEDLVPPGAYFRVNPILSSAPQLNEHRSEKLTQIQSETADYVRGIADRMAGMCDRLMAPFGNSQDACDTGLPVLRMASRVAGGGLVCSEVKERAKL